MREFRLKIVILLEPRTRGETADKVCKKLGKKRWVRSKLVGFSGGVWVIWDDEEVELKMMTIRRSFIHMKVG